jgi:hypothetical protein
MAVYDVVLPVSAIVVVIIDFPNDILWVLLVQREIRIDARMNENAVLIDVHQRQSLDPGGQVLAFDDQEVVQLLRAAIAREGDQTVYARRHGLERTGLNMILRGKRPVSRAVMKALGLRKLYVPK